MPRALALRSRALIESRVADRHAALGAGLGALMLKYNVPALALAELLNVSSDTIYRWTYSDVVPEARRQNVRTLLSDLRVLRTPLKGTVAERTAELHTLLSNKGR